MRGTGKKGRWIGRFIPALCLAAGMMFTSGADSLAAVGDVIRSGVTGDCSYRVVQVEGNSLGWTTYRFAASGSGKMGDYNAPSENYYATTAPWSEDMKFLRQVEIGEGVTRVGNNAFSAGLSGCYVETATFADSVDTIAQGAFYHQCRLTDVSFGSGLTYIGDSAFECTGIKKLNLPDGLKTIDERGFNAVPISVLELPDSLTALRRSAFRECRYLKTVNFGNGLKTIGSYAFLNCENLKTLVIPAGLEKVSDHAFEGCDNITDIYYGGTPLDWNSLEIGTDNGTFRSANLHYGLPETFSLNTDMPVAGSKLFVRLTVGENDFDLGKMNIRWQKSWTGTENWIDLTGNIDPKTGLPVYVVQAEDENYRIRAVISKAGFPEEIYTEPQKVLDGISIDNTFSDSKLRDYLKTNFDPDHNGQLTISEIEKITTLHLGGLGIKSLKGVDKLTELEYLYAYRNDITSVRLQNMNYLLVVDLSDNTNLWEVDLSGSHRLIELDLAGSGIKNVDISDNPELKELTLYGSNIGKISIRNNPYLVDAVLYGKAEDKGSYTQYSSDQGKVLMNDETPLVARIDEETFPSEKFRLTILDQNFDWDQDRMLSLWEARAVKNLSVEDEEEMITTLQGIEYFPELVYLSASNDRITGIDLCRNTKLESLYIGGNCLTSIDVSMLSKLEVLDVAYNPALGELDLSGNPELWNLWCDECGLRKLNLSGCPELKKLSCYGTSISELSIGANAGLLKAYAGKKTSRQDGNTGTTYWNYTSQEDGLCSLSVDPSTRIKKEKNGTWKKSNKGWWYLYDDGTWPASAWAKIDGKWYHFDKDGYLQYGWTKVDGKWYYLIPGSGAMATGWRQINGHWYFLTPGSGVLVTGWKQISGVWYYFKPNGIMAAGEYCKGYRLNANGSWTYKPKAVWVKNAKGYWYFGDSNGWIAKSCKLTIDDKSYTFNGSGVCLNPQK